MFIMSKFTVKIANAGAEVVIEEFLDALEAMCIERFLNVWHENGVQIMPYAPAGFPARLEGKEAIRGRYGILFEECNSMRIPDRVFHFTNEPNRVWVEFRGEIQIKATCKSFSNNYVCLFTVRDGKIIEYKEYFNPIIFLHAFSPPEAVRMKSDKLPKKK
jgi:ketosteroid isomerase-like protein